MRTFARTALGWRLLLVPTVKYTQNVQRSASKSIGLYRNVFELGEEFAPGSCPCRNSISRRYYKKTCPIQGSAFVGSAGASVGVESAQPSGCTKVGLPITCVS